MTENEIYNLEYELEKNEYLFDGLDIEQDDFVANKTAYKAD